MYKVLIVDDDFPVRMFLKRIINWNDYSCEIIGEAIDGEEGLEKIKQLNPDIILLDISMPIMDGVDLIKKVNDLNYSCKIIVLSCHDDFEYVKDALKLGAIEYILKNLLTKESLLKVIEIAKLQIENEQVKKVEYKKMEVLASKGLTIMKRQFVSQLINGIFNNKLEVLEKISQLEIEISICSNIIIALKVDNFLDTKELCNVENKSISIIDICQDILNDFLSGEVIQITENLFIIVYGISKDRSSEEILKDAFKISDRIRSSINKYLNSNITFGISDISNNIMNLNLYYYQALKALKLSFYSGSNKIYFFKDASKFDNNEIKLNKDDEKHFINLIKKGLNKELNSFMKSYFNEFRMKFYNPDYVYKFCIDIIFSINLAIKQYGISLKDIYGMEKLSPEVIQSIDTIDCLEQNMNQAINHVINILNDDTVEDVQNETIKKGLNYINSNYMRDISLNDVAEHVHMNTSYFSTLFKKVTGTKYLEYLKYIRIKKAKELIQTTNKKLNEISKEVGIANPKNFSKLFMEVEGITPMQYKHTEL